MDEMIEGSLNMPFSGGKALIDVTKLASLMDDLMHNLPMELEKSKAIIAEREQILNTAKREAETIIKRAEDRARAMVAQEEVLKQAQEKARNLMTSSEKESTDIRTATYRYADSHLAEVEQLMESQLAHLREVKNALKKQAKSAVNPQIGR